MGLEADHKSSRSADMRTSAKGAEPLPLGQAASSRRLTWRSVLLGSAGVCLVCGLTPYNDYIVDNTFMVGNYLPVVIVVTFFILTVLVNGPLHRLAPRRALTSGELGVIMMMMLVACGLPSQGLFREFLPIPVAVFHHGMGDPVFFKAFLNMHLPHWLFPVHDLATGTHSRIVEDFYGRVQPGDAIPYQPWIVPLLGWGVFIFAMLGTFLALMVLLRPQWAINERLAFPIAQIELALIEQPRPGRMLNDLMGNRLFWSALWLVFALQSLVALHRYFPRSVPEIPTYFDLGGVMTGEPWRYLNQYVKASHVYFTFIGIAFFIQSRTSFSLWSVYVVIQLFDMERKHFQAELNPLAYHDQHLGACVAYTAGFLWIGRKYFWTILRQAAGRVQNDSRTHLSSSAARASVIAVVVGVAIMMLWLSRVGVQPWVGGLIVALILMSHLVTARVVAETGMTYMRANCTPEQIYYNLPTRLFSGNDVMFMGVFRSMGAITSRESTLTFAMHGLQINSVQADGSALPAAELPGAPRLRFGQLGKLVTLMAWSLVLGYAVCAWSSLHCYYTYSTPIAAHPQNPVKNPMGLNGWPQDNMVQPVDRWAEGKFPAPTYNPWLHMGIGTGITAFLQVMSLRFSSWPFMPVGYLFNGTPYANDAWFSLMLGWLAKVLIVRFGGARLYQRAKPFFIGLIFGEALVSGFWLVINLLLAANGKNFENVQFLPT